MLFAISPAMNGSSQNDSAVQAQKRPAMLSEKVREVLRLKYSSFHQLWHKRRPGRADLQVSRSGGAAAPPYQAVRQCCCDLLYYSPRTEEA